MLMVSNRVIKKHNEQGSKMKSNMGSGSGCKVLVGLVAMVPV